MKDSPVKCRCRFDCLFIFSIAIILFQAFSVDGFGPIDDHGFISTISLGKNFGFYILPELGRFMPLTSQEYIVFSKLFEPSPYLFHIISGVKGLLVGMLLIYGLRLMQVSVWVSFILWSAVIFSVGFANAILRLQIGEINILLLSTVFLVSVLFIENKKSAPVSKKKWLIAVGVLAFIVSLFYKELVFILALCFSSAELLRYFRSKSVIPRFIWSLLVVGVLYILSYGIWRLFNYNKNSYAAFHINTLWDIFGLFASNDPFVIFIVIPLTIYRVFVIARTKNQHTIYDSFLIAATAYTFAYFALSIFNTYYLLPVYGFAIFGVAGVFANYSRSNFKTFVLCLAVLFNIYTFPVSISDAQSLKNIANSHYNFVKYISEWIVLNPLPNGERRNLVLNGVSSGQGAEIIISLRLFLLSLGVSDDAFEIKPSEPTDNDSISLFYNIKNNNGYNSKVGDIVIYNPYQSVFLSPPLMSPSYYKIYRSVTEWSLPRWNGLEWFNNCILTPIVCMSNFSKYMKYSGYSAVLVTRKFDKLIKFEPITSFSYRVRSVSLPERFRAGSTKNLDILIENTGNETWPADGTNNIGKRVHLSYVWLNENSNVVLEGDRSPFPEPMQPSDMAKLSVSIKAPSHPGKYQLIISPVQEGVRWFYPGETNDVARIIEIY